MMVLQCAAPACVPMPHICVSDGVCLCCCCTTPDPLPAPAQAASDVYAPVSGEVVEINSALVDEPAKVGWRLGLGVRNLDPDSCWGSAGGLVGFTQTCLPRPHWHCTARESHGRAFQARPTVAQPRPLRAADRAWEPRRCHSSWVSAKPGTVSSRLVE